MCFCVVGSDNGETDQAENTDISGAFFERSDDEDEGEQENEENEESVENEKSEKGNAIQKKKVDEKFQANLNNFFILYGPYGAGVYNFDITNCLTMDTRGIDSSAKKNKDMNKSSMKEKTTKERNKIR